MSWHLEKSGDDIVLFQNGIIHQNRCGEVVGPIVEVGCGNRKDVILFKFRGEMNRKWLSRSALLPPSPDSFSAQFKATTSNEEFVSLLTRISNVVRGFVNRKRRAKSSLTPVTADKQTPMPTIHLQDVNPVQHEMCMTDADKAIEECLMGKFDVSVMTLTSPPEQLMCRDLSREWVDNLKESIRASPTHNYSTLPCCVDISEVADKANFNVGDLPSYTVYTLGGNHLRTALQELLQENEGSHFDNLRQIRINLYAGLSNLQARRLGNLHNLKGETYRMSLFDKIKLCRRILYEMSGKGLDEEPPQSTAEWKSRCLLELGEENKTIGSLCTVLHVARYTARCWTALTQIMQKSSIQQMSRCGQAFFQKFQGLSDEYRYNLLRKVATGSMSPEQAGREARDSKKMEVIRATFNYLTESSSWDQATQTFPHHSDEAILKRKFLDMKFDPKNIPAEFILWCKEAMGNGRQDEGRADLTIEIRVYKDGCLLSDPAINEVTTRYRTPIQKAVETHLRSVETRVPSALPTTEDRV